MYDYHVHSFFSPDSLASCRETIKEAVRLNLSGLCFTDHIDFDYPDLPMDKHLVFEEYHDHLKSLKTEFVDELEIMIGLEVGMQPSALFKTLEYLEGKDLDFVLGSIHLIKGQCMYQGDILKSTPKHKAQEIFFEETLYCIENFPNFDVLGHLDVLRRYGPYDDKSIDIEANKNIIDKILSTLILNDKGIEVNTSPTRYGMEGFHPTENLVKRYFDLGGRHITIGSDSHRVNSIGSQLREALSLLRDVGFKEYTIYKRRNPVFLPIK